MQQTEIRNRNHPNSYNSFKKWTWPDTCSNTNKKRKAERRADLKLLQQLYKDHVDSGAKTYSLEEVKERLNL